MNGAARPRVLAIMGSGETAPTMSKVHRRLLGQLGRDARAVLLDTPYGFQENADEITARTIEYFAQNVGVPMALAPFRGAEPDPLVRATSIARAREADYLFAGPGSPSYALRHWAGTELPAILADKLAHGGVVTFASAAALTLGAFTVPVYEIYKVGDEPRWLPGLDLLGAIGLTVALIPHYDNAEGGTHDTRYCYLGERRLAILERQLPEGAFVIGVDSHTALLLDLAAGTASVDGLGGVTVRVAGRSHVLPAGAIASLDELRANAGALARADAPAPERPRPAAAPPADANRGITASATPLLDTARALEQRFDAALREDATDAAVRALLELETTLVDWSRDSVGTDEMDRSRAILHALVVRLGEHAAGPDDTALTPLVESLLESRTRARASGDFAAADRIRVVLAAAGIELQDAAEGTSWHRVDRPPA